MASKKPASKVRKATRAPAVRAAARKPAAHRTEPRKAPATARRAGASRPAASGARRVPAAPRPAARAPARPVALGARPEPAKPAAAARALKSAPPVPARPATGPAAPPARVMLRAAGDRDDVEGLEPSSLLAGPRNVKPYVAKRGEQYMGKQQLKHFQEILTNWKRDLMMEVDRTVTHMKDEAANFPDPNDRATQEEEFSLELRTRDRERKLIRKIDEALKRAEDGSYGYCLETGEEIGIKRLEARPVATLSLEAQERRERRERQYGDRDDRYR
jgi:RNA polymerase-binding transcription factor